MFTIQHLYIKVLSRTSVPLVCTTLDAIWELPNRINSTTPFWINYFPKMLTSAYSLLPLQGKAIKQSMECPLCTCRDISSYCTNSHPMNILSIGLLDYLRPNLRRKAPPVQKVGSVEGARMEHHSQGDKRLGQSIYWQAEHKFDWLLCTIHSLHLLE